MSDSSDDDFFMASASEDEDELRNELQNVIVESSKKIEEPEDTKLNLSSDTDGSVYSKEKRPETIKKKPEDNSDEEFEVISKNDDAEISTRKRTRSSRKSIESNDQIILDSSNPSSAKNSRSNSFSSDTESTQKKVKTNNSTHMDSDDENDEFFKELAKNRTPKTTKSIEEVPSAPENQPKRIFSIRFISKLDGTINKSVRVKVLGKFPFSKILPSALEGLIKAYKIPNIMKKFYTVENVALYWNNAKLLNFMTCNSLNIKQSFENEFSNVDIMLVSKEMGKSMELTSELEILRDEQKLMDEKKKAAEKKMGQNSDNINKEKSADLVIEEFERELQDIIESDIQDKVYSQVDTEEDNKSSSISDQTIGHDVFQISLVGQDNKKLSVNVRNSTLLSKLTTYYRAQKNLPQNTNLELLFDDEKLNLNKTIGDQDIEEEDMIDVVILK